MKNKYFGTDGIRGTVTRAILLEKNSLNLDWPNNILKIQKE